MKKLLIALTLMLASNAFASTYYVQYSVLTTNPTTQLDKTAFQSIPVPGQGSISVYTLDEQKKPTYLKQETFTQSPLNLTFTFSKNLAVITDTNNKFVRTVQAQTFFKILTGAFISAQFPMFNFGVIPVIDTKVQETVANALGNNNFTVTLAQEINSFGCNTNPAKAVVCVEGINRIYRVDAQ
jgi:hypothetical protein